MTVHEEMLTLVHALKKSTGEDYALLVGPHHAYKAAKHKTPIPFGDETAMAVLLHNERDDLPEHQLYVSYEPTPMCMGLVWRSKVANVHYIKDDGKTYLTYPMGGRDASDTGWQSTSNQIIAVVHESQAAPTDYTKFIKLMRLKYPSLAQALDHMVVGRTQNEDIKRKLSYGLNDRKPITAPEALPRVHDDFMRIVYALVRLGWNDKEPDEGKRAGAGGLRPFGNNIGGIMVDNMNRIIAWGLNFKHVNPTFHAETMMIQYYLRRNNLTALPAGARVYTSLECCYMCAGYIATLGKGVQVFYGQKDPNIAGKNALALAVNGCTQHPSQIIPTSLSQGMSQGDRDVIKFLFDRKKAGAAFGGNLKETRVQEYANFKNDIARNATLVEGDRFLCSLQDMGLLHDTIGAPLGIVLPKA